MFSLSLFFSLPPPAPPVPPPYSYVADLVLSWGSRAKCQILDALVFCLIQLDLFFLGLVRVDSDGASGRVRAQEEEIGPLVSFQACWFQFRTNRSFWQSYLRCDFHMFVNITSTQKFGEGEIWWYIWKRGEGLINLNICYVCKMDFCDSGMTIEIFMAS